MASLQRLVILLYFLGMMIIKVHEAALTISAKNKISFPQEPLVINCKVGTSTTLSSVYAITLRRNTSNTGKEEDWKEIAFVNVDGPGISSSEGTQLATRATVTGKLIPVTSAELVLEIKANEVRCTDAASYQCALLGAKPGDSSYGEKDEKAVAIEVLPSSTSDIDVSPYSSPNEEMHTYEPGTVVTLTCTGMVGNPPRLHRWCKQGVNDPDGFVGSTDVINQDFRFTYQSDSCSYQRTSQLKYKIRKQDTEIKFMCEDATNSRCGDGLFPKQVKLKNDVQDNYVSTTTIKSEKSSNKNDGCQENEEKSQTNNGQPNATSIVLISIAAVVLVLCCIYAVWNAVTRIRQKQNGLKEKPIVLQNNPRREVQLGQRSVNAFDCSLDGAPNNPRGLYVRSTAKVIYGREKLRKEKPGGDDTKNTSNTYQTLGRPDEPNNYQALERDQDYEIL